MPAFKIVPSRSYNPTDNPVNRTKGVVGGTSASTTVSVTSLDPVTVSSINSVLASRTVTLMGSTLPQGGTVTSASGTSVTLTYGYQVNVTGASNDWIEWYYNDVPNSKQQYITKVMTTGTVTLDYIDIDGSRGTLSGITGTNQFDMTIARTLSTTSGTILGISNGSAI
jgi:hypothetical protein